MKLSILKTVLFIGAPLFLIKTTTAQNTQPLGEFSKIKVEGTAQVELIIADRYSFYTDGNLDEQPYVKNNMLYVPAGTRQNETIKIYAKNIAEVIVDDRGVLTCNDTLFEDNFLIKVDGVGKATIITSGKNITIDVDGASQLTISGKAESMTAKVDGISKLKAGELKATQVNIETDGASSATVYSTTNITAKSDGSSTIKFAGNPPNQQMQKEGISTLKNIDKDITYEIENNDGDTTKLNVGKYKLLVIEDEKKKVKEEKPKKMKHVYAGLETGMGVLTTSSYNTSLGNQFDFLETQPGRSWFWGLNLFEFDMPIVKNHLALTTGLGFQWAKYSFDNDFYLTPNTDSLIGTNNGVALSTNKLYTFDINAPLLIKYAPIKKGKGKGFHIAAGAIVRYVAKTRVYTETDANGYKQETTYRDDFNINPFKVDATVRIGYNKVNLFANAALTPYFNASNAPDVRTFAAGITLIGF